MTGYDVSARGLRTLFLQPPSFAGFDGGAGSRYQAKREVRSFWFPTWLAQPAALVPGSRVLDAPADGLTHGTFILGLPGETTATIQKTIEFAMDIAHAA